MSSWWLLTLTALVALSTYVSVVSYTRFAYGDWTLTSSLAHQSLVFAGPLAAAFAAWTSARSNDARSVILSLASVRAGMPAVLSQMAPLAGAALLGWVAGYTPLFFDTSSKATWGGPDPLVILSAAAALVALTWLGYFFGTIAPAYLALALAIVVPYGITVASDAVGPTISPVWSFFVLAGQQEDPFVVIFRIIFFSVVAFSVLLSSARIVSDRRQVLDPRAYRGLVFLLIPCAAIAVSQSLPEPTRWQADPPRACSTDGATTVCVHQAKAGLVPALLASSLRVRELVGMPEGSPLEIYDDALTRGGASGNSSQVVLALQAQAGDGWLQYATSDMAWILTGNLNCAGTTAIDSSGYSSSDISGGIASWVANIADGDSSLLTGNPKAYEVSTELAQLSEQQVSTRLSANLSAIQSCTATAQDLDLTLP